VHFIIVDHEYLLRLGITLTQGLTIFICREPD
jgi:hypothetical protein